MFDRKTSLSFKLVEPDKPFPFTVLSRLVPSWGNIAGLVDGGAGVTKTVLEIIWKLAELDVAVVVRGFSAYSEDVVFGGSGLWLIKNKAR